MQDHSKTFLALWLPSEEVVWCLIFRWEVARNIEKERNGELCGYIVKILCGMSDTQMKQWCGRFKQNNIPGFVAVT